jgi:hypothetical protein
MATDQPYAVNWTGKIVGCAIFEPLLERVGFKKTIYILSAIQIIAVISKYLEAIEQVCVRAAADEPYFKSRLRRHTGYNSLLAAS